MSHAPIDLEPANDEERAKACEFLAAIAADCRRTGTALVLAGLPPHHRSVVREYVHAERCDAQIRLFLAVPSDRARRRLPTPTKENNR